MLEFGPAGMKLDDNGVLSWEVPAQFAEVEASVLITVGDASGQEVFHAFPIAVEDAAGSDPPPDPEVSEPGETKPTGGSPRG